jgi:hypothetical protein
MTYQDFTVSLKNAIKVYSGGKSNAIYVEVAL